MRELKKLKFFESPQTIFLFLQYSFIKILMSVQLRSILNIHFRSIFNTISKEINTINSCFLEWVNLLLLEGSSLMPKSMQRTISNNAN